MAAIKFSKQYIEPNPNEIDYWVDLSSNQYGGRMKYYNGFEWVDLVNPDGTHIDINDFYNKLQINQMLSQKASVDSVESKVDDDEVSDVIKNISFSQRGEDGVEMVMFKYDDTTVGIQLPIADNTKSGIITKDTFKNLVNQTQLQQLYSEMYTKLSEIRNNYQPKLRAGANIKIENNVISAVSKIGTDWNDIANKPDIYDKSQVDTMMSGVYKIKGSRRFEALPLYTNTVGDTYNITNDFSLHGEDYPMGTNVVWTENGWDALAGIFDTSELEEDIQEVKDNYLPLSGGRLNSGTDTPLVILGTDHSWIGFKNSKDTDLGWIGVLNSKLPSFYSDKSYKIWHEGNDGNGSGLDADLLGGIQSSQYVKDIGWISNTDLNSLKNCFTCVDGGTSSINAPATHGNVVSFKKMQEDGYGGLQLFGIGTVLYYRNYWDNKWGNWKTIAFTDSNVASASKLKTPVKLWGNDFDGSGDINGLLKLWNNTAISWNNSSGEQVDCLKLNDYNNLVIGEGVADSKKLTIIDGYNIFMRYSADHFNGFLLNESGNVGIGTIDPSSKLDVKSDLDTVARFMSTSNTNKAVTRYIGLDNKYWAIGKGAGSSASVFGFYSSSYEDNVLTLKDTGNVGIGINTPGYKLDVNGTIHTTNGLVINNDACIYGVSTNNENIQLFKINTFNDLLIGHGTISLSSNTFIDGTNLVFRSGSTTTNSMIINESKNIGIGTDNPTSKLHVNGSIYSSSTISGNYFIGGHDLGYFLLDSKGVANRSMCITPSDNLLIGADTAVKGFGTTIDGNSIKLRYGTTHTNGIILNSSGNVTMGNDDYASINHRLYVAGSAVVSYRAYINDNLVVDKQISSGDLVDWYGVSWSEDSSDPTCTRIGNMALHRSLPILSAMKGYYIGNFQSACPECMLPLNDNWSKLHYNMTDNGEVTVTSFVSGNIMVKIPEFWYIDEYDGTTKTHNLKISQTAKAGWCHHKEAYVGAYEGRSYDTCYKSVKGVIPTVSLSRTELRQLARANGYEDEYKWSIYTYEEHRAICHLFLVEYATRNSQAPVNTALTSDGFKQGGLGSGCTTGTATVNGQTTYSFIPTGTTDSLGNGSGQVAYTVMLTDADGNEIGTVTRYANRYRGIENPFGHIWKHVDDIVNVYNAGSGNKTIYKCNKPEHFATNKNAKYKPLCSFPSGSTMQGWSKEIKATINCDFFKYSVGGSESTYWCDYDYDNDDTSEHCILIGGYSGNGGRAGLFSFALTCGVGHSAVDIGSRLTYIPWAE